MISSINDLTIITITYNNINGLIKTYESLKDFRDAGGTHLIINGGKSISNIIKQGELIEEPDKGIYDALNKGISIVKTSFFMLIHSGDFLAEKTEVLESLLIKMKNEELDFLLNDCAIDYRCKQRLMTSSKWKPWMFKFGAQPPHPPTIYRSLKVKQFQYDLNHPVIADFKYFEDLFQAKLKWNKGNKLLIRMSAGGATSSGIRSFFFVNSQFKRLKGPFKMALFAITRPLIKIYQMV